ncbi:MAG: 16S rRNA (cytosine(1402)-N(4))-methyltransferase RsmH [Candidatus Acetothermia bacterium]|jgi:16S rRNA (cytosine1402-N4)-methyltransferase|nr:16S rRNA (cytosine(1402)-N(4))-methyltransferase RsmH [Candidatus Acetothermia bacterium]MDH7504702.1 16S rRNA (cytosine(1402)-N(4))-methyltransferase RsmH [Candidatus Acetothermia bacterium]
MSQSRALPHKPVLLQEVISLLGIRDDGIYLDATVGCGGHAYEIAKRLDTGLLIGIDWDSEALECAHERLKPFEERVRLVQANFRDLAAVLDRLGVAQVHGLLFDLGLSSMHLDSAERGFSFRSDGPLDMRMDREHNTLTAAEIVNSYTRDELIKILREYGEERWAPRIVSRIVEAREREPLERTAQLAELVSAAIPAPARRAARRRVKIHPATRTFQALRIAVNDELGNLRAGLEAGFSRLAPGGMMVVISFHSLEDRIVKQFFRGLAERGEAELRKLIRPTPEEIAANPRARSAKLRAAARATPKVF